MLEPKVIYETEDFLAVDKPAGLQVHGAKIHKGSAARAAEPTLVDWLVKTYPQAASVGDDPALRPGIVHRLDKGTSGVMLIAKTQAGFAYLKSLFQKHEVTKTYVALVRGVPKEKEGTIDAPIGIVNGTLKRSTRSSKMRKEAVTTYSVIKTVTLGNEKYALLKVNPLTGRTHQIRVHLASIGHPVAGDRLYGPKKPDAPRLMLHAAAIAFAPVPGSRITLEAALPKEFSTGLSIAGG